MRVEAVSFVSVLNGGDGVVREIIRDYNEGFRRVEKSFGKTNTRFKKVYRRIYYYGVYVFKG